MEKEVNTDLILHTLEAWVKEKHQISPVQWLDAGLKLTALMGDEHEKLYDLAQDVYAGQKKLMEEGFTAAKAQVFIKASVEYRNMKIQEARIKQVEELIRLSKKFAQLRAEEARGIY